MDTEWNIYERAATWQDRASPRGKADDAVRAVLDRRDPLPNLAGEAADGDYAGRFAQVTASWPLLLPHHPDLLAAHAHARLNRGLLENRSGTEPLLDTLPALLTAGVEQGCAVTLPEPFRQAAASSASSASSVLARACRRVPRA